MTASPAPSSALLPAAVTARTVAAGSGVAVLAVAGWRSTGVLHGCDDEGRLVLLLPPDATLPDLPPVGPAPGSCVLEVERSAALPDATVPLASVQVWLDLEEVPPSERPDALELLAACHSLTSALRSWRGRRLLRGTVQHVHCHRAPRCEEVGADAFRTAVPDRVAPWEADALERLRVDLREELLDGLRHCAPAARSRVVIDGPAWRGTADLADALPIAVDERGTTVLGVLSDGDHLHLRLSFSSTPLDPDDVVDLTAAALHEAIAASA
ncbi:hypothetical protein SAMN06264364_102189 [Quadrisphaera granulorum]|uniref:DUF2470 domain-containing protein n=1 Tax=Quadrisphaera granulorum TaxID=317664 RepID=A0A316ADK6_9ACTN|nr:hypothetical protein [Quadrisphaera granulorum]PWJ55823.1 hypothetical protein BXY45_102189 [Quadrisphaera granulorum]SZE95320.1 hypothetical protein SAMN06264364_102189 [Quadrisphaera granulorum]